MRRADGGADEVGPTAQVDLLGGGHVVAADGLGSVGGGGGEDGHGAVEAFGAGGTHAAGEVDAKGEVVDVGVGGRGGVGDGVGKAWRCVSGELVGMVGMG